MAEKVKVYITKDVHSILSKDIELFEFKKKNGTVNQNAFINTLIANYTTDYEETKSRTYNEIRSLLEDRVNLSTTEIGEISNQILRFIDDTNQGPDQTPTNITLSFKPTKVSSAQYDRIKNTLLTNDTESNYFRQLFTSYARLPQNARERILFKHVVNKLEQAIQEKKKVSLTFTDGHIRDFSPYSLCSSKEELFNYLLCENKDKKPETRRLTRIQNVTILNEESTITQANKELLQWASENSPQYVSKPMEVKVQLTEKGKELVQRIYIHRPKRIKHDSNDGFYYFETTKEQALHYFPKLGRHAMVIQPETVALSIYKQVNSIGKNYWRTHKEAIQKDQEEHHSKKKKL